VIAAPPGHEPTAPRLLVQRGRAIVAVAAPGHRTAVLHRAADAVFSPDGTSIAFRRGGDLWIANADGSGERRLSSTGSGTVVSPPSWLPGGRGVVYGVRVGARRSLRVVDLPTGRPRRLAASAGEEWAPAVSRTGRLAFVSNRSGRPELYVASANGTGAVRFGGPDPSPAATPVDARDLTWSPSGRELAYTSVSADGTTSLVLVDGAARTVVPTPAAHPRRPVFSPDGTRIAYTDEAGDLDSARLDGSAWLRLGTGTPTDWQVVPVGAALYPNLVQRPPTQLIVQRKRGRWLLGFTSLVDNRGPGVLRIRAKRPPRSRVMPARQLIDVTGGWTRVVPSAGELEFAVAEPHLHWHYLAFDRYELVRAGSLDVAVRDRKQGFCLSDTYGVAPGMRHGPARFTSRCARGRPHARTVSEGLSVGYTDRYFAFYEGQSLDLTTLPAGRYWLVNRANPDFHLRELRYGDDAASLLLEVSWPHGRGAAPNVEVLRTCRRERC
jgi:dipeptidyl aminopeptidase/acylaminoacyl peptidase